MLRGTIEEKVAVLNGERQNRKAEAAVTVADLAGLAQIAERLQSAKAAGSTPTKAEFDALVADVAAIHKRLLAVAEALGARLR